MVRPSSYFGAYDAAQRMYDEIGKIHPGRRAGHRDQSTFDLCGVVPSHLFECFHELAEMRVKILEYFAIAVVQHYFPEQFQPDCAGRGFVIVGQAYGFYPVHDDVEIVAPCCR